LLTEYYSGDHNREDEMAVEYVAHMGRTEMHTEFCWGNLNERDHLEDIKLDLIETGWKSMTWFHLAQEKDKWQALVNMVINL
jgi:hypothetical protein